MFANPREPNMHPPRSLPMGSPPPKPWSGPFQLQIPSTSFLFRDLGGSSGPCPDAEMRPQAWGLLRDMPGPSQPQQPTRSSQATSAISADPLGSLAYAPSKGVTTRKAPHNCKTNRVHLDGSDCSEHQSVKNQRLRVQK